MRIAPDGDLLLRVPHGEVRQHKPVIYQEANGIRESVEGQYVRKSNRTIGFELGKYDARRPLVIDPRLNYSTFIARTSYSIRGFGGEERGNAIAVDSSGSAYVTGWTQSTDFPTLNAFQSSLKQQTCTNPSTGQSYQCGQNAFVAELNADGTALYYSSYLGGTHAESVGASDLANSIAVDSVGNAYVTGQTTSADFPTVNAIQSSFHSQTCTSEFGSYQCGLDAFVAKIGSTLAVSSFSPAKGRAGATVAIYAAQRGLHVLAEKPIAVTVSEADAMVDAAREHGVVLGVMFQERTHPLYHTAHRLVSRVIIEGSLFHNPHLDLL